MRRDLQRKFHGKQLLTETLTWFADTDSRFCEFPLTNTTLEIAMNITWATRACVAAALVAALLLGPQRAEADGFYIGAGVGGATLEADLNGITIPGLPSSIDEDDTATKIFAGYNFDLTAIEVGIEAGYVDFGAPDVNVLGDPLALDTTGINLWGIAAIDTGLFEIYGKLGYIVWDVEAEYLGQTAADDGNDLGYGLGVRFGIGPLEARGEYETYDLDDTDLTMLSVGLVYYFD